MPLQFSQSGRSSVNRTNGAIRRSRLTLETLEDRTVLSSGASAPTIDLGSIQVQNESYAQDHILVQFRPSAQPTAQPGTTLINLVDSSANLYQVQLQSGVSVSNALSAYRSASNVTSAEPDYYLASSAIPNDSRFRDQWALNNTGQSSGRSGADIGVTSAWDITTGSTKTVVSIMDTGVDYSHPDLYLNIWINQGEIPSTRRSNFRDIDGDGLITFWDLNDSRNQGAGKITDINRNGRIDAGDLLYPMSKDSQGKDNGWGGWENGISEDGDSYVDDITGWNFNSNTNDPKDDFGHGTHVAGTIGAIGNNNTGTSGINWKIQMMPVKFIGASGAGSVSQFIAALNYAVAKGAKISNNSWAGAGYSSLLVDAISRAASRGHIFVAAAGNNGSNNDSVPTYPASFDSDNVVAVAATDRNDQLAGFSNYGSRSVDIAAPGVDILSTTVGGSYGNNSGTSMATPQVTGVMALVWSQHPTWSYRQVINQVLSTVDRLPTLSGKVSTGGRLNAAAAVGVARVASTPPRVNSAVWSGPAANSINTIRVTFDRSVSQATFTGPDVRLTRPDGQSVGIWNVRAVAGTNDRTYDITFGTQTMGGTYTVQIGPEVKDYSGTKMAVYSSSYRITVVKTYTSETDVNVNRGSRAVSLFTVTDNVTIGDLNVKLNINHPKIGDLYIHLQAPDGTNIILSNRKGGSTANMTNTTFDDQASWPIGFGQGPFNGSYKPEVALSNLIGKNARGTWKMWIEDRGGSSQGTLLNWSLIITQSTAQPRVASIMAIASDLVRTQKKN